MPLYCPALPCYAPPCHALVLPCKGTTRALGALLRRVETHPFRCDLLGPVKEAGRIAVERNGDR